MNEKESGTTFQPTERQAYILESLAAASNRIVDHTNNLRDIRHRRMGDVRPVPPNVPSVPPELPESFFGTIERLLSSIKDRLSTLGDEVNAMGDSFEYPEPTKKSDQ